MGCTSSSTAANIKDSPQSLPSKPKEASSNIQVALTTTQPLAITPNPSASITNEKTQENALEKLAQSALPEDKESTSDSLSIPQTKTVVTVEKPKDRLIEEAPQTSSSEDESIIPPTEPTTEVPTKSEEKEEEALSTVSTVVASNESSISSSPSKRKAPSKKKNNRGYIDFQSFLELDNVQNLKIEFSYLLDDQILEVFEVLDDDEDGFVTSQQAEEIVFAIRGREQQSSQQSASSSTISQPESSTGNKKVLKPLEYSPEPPTTPKKSLIRSNSSMAMERGIILNDFVAESVTVPISPPPQVKRGFLVTSSGNSPLSSPSRPNSTNLSRTPSLGARSRFHVLDQGILYHLDSNVTSGPVALDKHGFSLRGHTIITSQPDSNCILLSTKGIIDEEEDEIITLEIKSEQDRVDWIHAIQEHINYIREQEYTLRQQLLH